MEMRRYDLAGAVLDRALHGELESLACWLDERWRLVHQRLSTKTCVHGSVCVARTTAWNARVESSAAADEEGGEGLEGLVPCYTEAVKWLCRLGGALRFLGV